MVDGEAKQFASVAADCAESSTDALAGMEKFLDALKQKQSSKNAEGVSLLDVKNREMLAYVSEVSFLMERMSAGQSIVDSPSVLRAAHHRTVIERLRPIEDKMKSQIDKLTQMDASKTTKGKGPLRARPDQMELDDDDDSGEENEDEEEEGADKQKKYVPPKMVAMHYQESTDQKGENRKAKARMQAMQSSLIQDLKQQYSEAPEEFREVSQRKYELDRAREEYEEDHLVRMHVSRKDRLREEKMSRDNAMDDLLKFGNYMWRDEEKGGKGRKRPGGPRNDGQPKLGRFDKKKISKAKKRNAAKQIKRRQ